MTVKHRKGLKALFWKALIRLTYHRAEQILAVSDEIRKDLISHFMIPADKIRVLYNAYDLRHLDLQASAELSKEYQDVFQKPTLITMGRMNSQKGQWHLIRAFPIIKSKISDAQLVILGEGQMMEKLKMLAGQSGFGDSIHFPGFQKNPHHFIAKASAYILTSHHEGFPNALAEAMACGVPVVSADCHSGPREILAPSEVDKLEINYGVQDGRFGLLYPVDYSRHLTMQVPLTESETQLADQVITLLTDPTRHQQFANLSRQRIADFGLETVIRQWEAIIQGE